MAGRAAIFVLLTLVPAALPGDDLPPEVLLLSRVKRHVREQLERLPDYTCLQTTARYRRPAGTRNPANPTDIVVLEVLTTGPKELYASPGAREFHADNPAAFTAGGLSGTGMFGLFLEGLFVNDVGTFQFRGPVDRAGRRAVRWDYRIPVMLSGFTIQLNFAKGVVGMKGSFWADPETLDLLSLEVQADDIPPNLRLFSAIQTIDYAKTRIGQRDTILPQSAAMHTIETDGSENRNFVEFTHCRSFTTESKLTFDAPSEPAVESRAKAPPKDIERAAVPAGLMVTIELAEPLTEQERVGTLIDARISADVKERGKLVAPAGAVVHGRIRRLERQEGYFVVGLEFTEIETDTGPVRFYANVQDVDKPAKFFLRRMGRGRGRQVQNQEIYLSPYLPGVAAFFMETDHLHLPKGFKSVWKTTSPRSAIR